MKPLLAPLLCILSLATHLRAADQPNIIVILVDDMGWMDLSCQGSDYYKTPAIDQIATEEVVNAMRAGLNVRSITQSIYVHPALPEVVQRAFGELDW